MSCRYSLYSKTLRRFGEHSKLLEGCKACRHDRLPNERERHIQRCARLVLNQ